MSGNKCGNITKFLVVSNQDSIVTSGLTVNGDSFFNGDSVFNGSISACTGTLHTSNIRACSPSPLTLNDILVIGSGSTTLTGDMPVTGGITTTSYSGQSLSINGGTIYLNGVTIDSNSNTFIPGNVTIEGSATTINTTVINAKDNNITINYSGTNVTAQGGGITLEDGQSDGVDSTIKIDTNGCWTFDPGICDLNLYGVTTFNGPINITSGSSLTFSGDSVDFCAVDEVRIDNIISCNPYLGFNENVKVWKAGSFTGLTPSSGITHSVLEVTGDIYACGTNPNGQPKTLWVSNIHACSPLTLNDVLIVDNGHSGDLDDIPFGQHPKSGSSVSVLTDFIVSGDTTLNGNLTVTGTTNLELVNVGMISGGTFYGTFAGTLSNDAYVTGSTLNVKTLELTRNQGLPTLTTDLSIFATTADTTNLQTQITSNDVEISSLSATTISLQTQVDSNDTDIINLSATTISLQNQITSNDIDISLIISGATEVVTNLLTLSGQVQTIDSNLVNGGSFDTNTNSITLNQNGGGTLSISGITDAYITGSTFNTTNNELTIGRNEGLPDIVTNLNISNVNDLTVNGDLTVTGTTTVDQINGTIFSGGTFYGTFAGTLSNDVYVTGATLNIDTLELSRNQGLSTLTVDLSIFSTTADTANLQTQITNNDLDISNLSATTISLQSQIDSNDTDISNLQGNVSTLSATTISLQSQIDSNDTDISNLSATTISLQSQVTNNDIDINNLSASTINLQSQIDSNDIDISSLSAQTQSNNDSLINSGTFDTNTNTITLNQNGGGTISVSGLTDVYLTGTTFNTTTNELTLGRNEGLPDIVSNINISNVNNLTVNGDLTVTGTTTVDQINGDVFSGGTFYGMFAGTLMNDVYVTGSTLNGTTLELSRNQGLSILTTDLSIFATTADTSNLQTQITNNDGDISNLSATTISLQSQVTNNDGDILSLSATTISLQTQVDSNDVDITNLSASTISLQTQIDGNDTDISNLSATTISLQTQINGNDSDITSLSAQTQSNFDDLISGGIFDTNTNSITLNQNGGGSITISGLTDAYVTGATLNGNSLELTRNEGLPLLSVDLSTLDNNDTFVTGFTYTPTNNTLTISRNEGEPNLVVGINTFSGITVTNDIDVRGGIFNSIGELLFKDDTRVDGNVVITGDATILGTTTTINTETLTIKDNIITLNSTLTAGTPTINAGIETLRGDEPKAQVIWNETLDRWEVGISGNTSQIVTEDNIDDFDIYVTGTTFNNSTNDLTITRKGESDIVTNINISNVNDLTVNGDLTVTGTTNLEQVNADVFSGGTFYGTFAGTLSNDAYVTGATLSGEVLELSRNQGLSTLSVDLSLFATSGDTTNLQNQITSNDLDISTLSATTISLQTQIDNNDTDISNLFALSASTETDIVNLQNQITSNDGDISSLSATTISLQTQIDGNDTDITNLSATTISIQNQVTNNDSDISSLSATTISLQNQIDSNDSDITTLSAQTQSISDDLISGGLYNDSTDTITLSQVGGGSIVITGITDSYVTGATMNGNSLELTRNEGLPLLSVDLSQFIDNTDRFVTGSTFNTTTNDLTLTRSGGLLDIVSNIDISNVNTLTINGDLTVTGTTNLEQVNADVFSGGTFYGTFAGTLSNDAYVTGATLNGETLELSRNQGLSTLTADLSLFATSGDTAGLQSQIDSNDVDISNLSATTISLQSQIDSNDTDISNIQTDVSTLSATTISLQNQIDSNDTDITNLSASTISLQNQITNNDSDITSLSAQTQSNFDDLITDGTYNDGTNTITFNQNGGGTISVSGLTDSYVTGLTFNSTTNELTTTRNEGLSNIVTSIDITNVDSLTVNGDLTVTGTTNVDQVNATTFSGGTFYGDGSNLTGISTVDSYVTGATLNGETLEISRNQGLSTLFVDLSLFATTGDTSGLQSQIDSNDTDISNLSATTISLQSQIDSNDVDITNLSATTISLQNQIDSNDTDISNLQTDLSTLSAQTQTISDDLINGGTFNDTTDTLTLNQVGGGSISITGLTDSYVTGATFNSNTNLLTLSGNDGFTDVTTNVDITNVDSLTVNGDLTVTGTTNLNQVNATTFSGGTFYGDGSNLTGISTVDTLSGLTDVNITAPANGQILTYTGGTWVNVNSAGGGGESNTASNVGVGEGIFKQKTGVDLEFKSISGGTGINISTGDTLVVSVETTTPKIKSGIVSNTSFTGNPKKATITFTTAFPDNNYTITVTGEDNRTFTIESKTSSGFVINTNSGAGLSNNTFWQTISVGEN